MPRSLVAVIFDMDGTLIDSSTVVPDAYIGCVRACGGPTYEREQIIAAYPLGPPEQILTHLLGRPCTAAEVDDYHVRLARLAARATVYPGITETLQTLAARLPLAVFTGASRRSCSILLDAVALTPHFTVLVGSDEVASPKPDPGGILLACRRLGVSPGEAAYVGDAAVDLEAARRSGALALAAGWGHLYSRNAHADRVLEHPLDLLDLLG